MDILSVHTEVEKIDIGSVFQSYAHLDKAIMAFEKIIFVQLYERSSRSLEAYAKTCPQKKLNPELKFSEIDFACVHGGKNFKTKSKGMRPNQQ